MSTLAVKQLQLAPLGAGDLIDRTVRLYRRHFGALVRASVPPVIVSAAGWVIFGVCFRAMVAAGSEGRALLYLLAMLAGLVVYALGLLSQLVVMGGASRNLVMNLLWGEPVTTRLIYRSVRSRFWALFRAGLVVLFWLIISAAAGLFAAGVVWFTALFVVGMLAASNPGETGAQWLLLVFFAVMAVVGLVLMLFVFFLVAGRVAYVPQVLMVEGRGVFDAVGRSSELARGNLRRLMGMFLFTSFAGYSVVLLLLFPLGWFAWLNGVNPLAFGSARLPSWYSVGSQVLGQVATILLAPVWMLGLSLLYVDERVRHEGYDIELLAAQVFGEMPAVPAGTRAPLAPAIAAPQAPRPPKPPPGEDVGKPPGSVLGL